MPFFGRKKPASPVQPRVDAPSMPGAWLFTLRSSPQHYGGIKEAIESTGEARVYFGEPLAYIKGQGIALFRVEATGFGWLDQLYSWWREAERDDAVGFEINLFVHNTHWLGSIRSRTPQEVEERIRQSAPTFQPSYDRRAPPAG